MKILDPEILHAVLRDLNGTRVTLNVFDGKNHVIFTLDGALAVEPHDNSLAGACEIEVTCSMTVTFGAADIRNIEIDPFTITGTAVTFDIVWPTP